jgi:hypothetical protein
MTDHRAFMLDCLATALEKHRHMGTALVMQELQLGANKSRVYMHALADAGRAVRYKRDKSVLICHAGEIPEGCQPAQSIRRYNKVKPRQALVVLRQGVADLGRVDAITVRRLLDVGDPVARRLLKLLGEQHGYKLTAGLHREMRVEAVDVAPLTISDLILDLLTLGPRRLVHCERELPEHNVESVRSAWTRLRGRGAIKPVGGRFYVAASHNESVT